MKRILILLAALVVVLAGSSNATVTRLTTLGQQFDALLDQANVYKYPSRILNYPKLAVAEVGNSSSILSGAESLNGNGGPYTIGQELRSVGVHWLLNGESTEEGFVLGTYLHNAEVYVPSISFPGFGGFDILDFTEIDDNLLPNRRIDLIYGRMLGNTPFGFHFGWTHSAQSFEQGGDVQFKEGLNVFDATFGLTFNENTDVYLMAQWISWIDQEWNGTETYDETEPGMNLCLELGGRKFVQRSNNYTYVKHASVMYKTFEATQNNTDGTGDDRFSATAFGAEVGIGQQWVPIEDVLAVLDAGIRYTSGSGKDEDLDGGSPDEEFTGRSIALFYWKLGAEFEIAQWLTGRLGAVSNWDWDSFTEKAVGPGDEDFTEGRSYASNQTYTGFGAHFGRLHVDANMDPRWILDGPEALTDDNGSSQWLWNVSLLVDFDEQ